MARSLRRAPRIRQRPKLFPTVVGHGQSPAWRIVPRFVVYTPSLVAQIAWAFRPLPGRMRWQPAISAEGHRRPSDSKSLELPNFCAASSVSLNCNTQTWIVSDSLRTQRGSGWAQPLVWICEPLCWEFCRLEAKARSHSPSRLGEASNEPCAHGIADPDAITIGDASRRQLLAAEPGRAEFLEVTMMSALSKRALPLSEQNGPPQPSGLLSPRMLH